MSFIKNIIDNRSSWLQKKFLSYIFVLSLLTATITLSACTSQDQQQYFQPLNQEYELMGDNLPVSRALAAKMVAHSIADIVTIYTMDIESDFIDVSPGLWHFPYINTVYFKEIMSGTGDNEFSPDMPLTLQQAQYILINLGADINLNITNETSQSPISFALWNQLYINALESISGNQSISEYFGIYEKRLIVLATEENNNLLYGGNIITNFGVFASTGVINSNFLDTEIKALVRGRDIITILEIVTTTPTLLYAFAIEGENGQVSVFTGGVERVFNTDLNMSAINFGDIVSLQINQGSALSYTLYNEIIENTTIERVTDSFIELFGIGRIPINENIAVYNKVGRISFKSLRNLIVGTSISNFVMDEEKIVAAIINERPIPNYLRVALNTTGFLSLIHDYIRITSDTYFTVTDTETRTYEPGQIAEFRTENDINGYRAYISPKLGGTLQVLSITRQWPGGQSPIYNGNMEIAWEGNGFSLINIVSLEEYLKAVVPSEMPSNFGLEASMIQAVTARSYAYNQFLANRQAAIGANVEDSVMSQVYNNIPANEISKQAVENTRGQVLAYNGNIISANFFSTSAGVTANNGEVWATKNRLPSPTRPYLRSVRQYLNNDFLDLSIEEIARAFFNERNIDAYDDLSPWFRWNTTMTANQVTDSINSRLNERYNASSSLIKTLQEDGTFRSRPITTIGQLVNIYVKSRGEGGNIMELVVEGTENTVLIITELNIRMLLAPRSEGEAIILNRWDGSQLSNFSMMPSSFFSMERLTNEVGEILYVRFIGGGFGHGVGMSQYGARGMLARGYNYLEILLHFYKGAEITTVF